MTRQTIKKWTAAALLLALAAAASGCQQSLPPLPTADSTATQAPSGASQTSIFSGMGSSDVSDVVERVSPCVVGLAVQVKKANIMGGESLVEGIGTGVIVDRSGYILTNHHVAGSAENITVVFEDGSKVPGETIWSDRALDLAVVKCEGGPYPAVELGTVESLKVGNPVVAIGTPLDLAFQHTVTAGVVSAKNRTLQVPTQEGLSFMEELIQTDAPINPGNSGGPLCDSQGKVVGINTVKVTEAEGLGFAIPIDICLPIVREIVETGSFVTPYMGLFTIDQEIARYYDVEMSQGICAMNVDTNGPAYQGGLRQGDCIVRVNGQEVSTVLALRRMIYETGIGGELRIEYLRDGAEGTAVCVPAEKPLD